MRVGPTLSVPRDWALDELLAQVAALQADVAALKATRSRLRRADRARLERLLPAIAGALGSDAFTVNELFEFSSLHLVLDGLPRAQVGQLLERAIGIPIDGYVVAKVGTELHRRLWTVTAAV